MNFAAYWFLCCSDCTREVKDFRCTQFRCTSLFLRVYPDVNLRLRLGLSAVKCGMWKAVGWVTAVKRNASVAYEASGHETARKRPSMKYRLS